MSARREFAALATVGIMPRTNYIEVALFSFPFPTSRTLPVLWFLGLARQRQAIPSATLPLAIHAHHFVTNWHWHVRFPPTSKALRQLALQAAWRRRSYLHLHIHFEAVFRFEGVGQRTDNRFAELSNGMYVTILEREVSKTQTLSVVPAPRRRFRRRPSTARDPPEGRSAHHRAAQYHEGRRQRYSDDRHLCRPRSQIHQGQVRRFPIWDIVFRVKGYG